MKNLRKVLVLLLAVMVLASVLGLQAFAAGSRNPEAYAPYSPYAAYGDEYRNCYVSLGDSISAGYDRLENKNIVGYLIWGHYDGAPKTAKLHKCYLLTDYQGKGLGSMMLIDDGLHKFLGYVVGNRLFELEPYDIEGSIINYT